MYHPYFRGKQYELIAIRETAALMAGLNFVPIIEPVKESLGGLERTLKTVCDAHGKAVVIVNPYHGDHREDGVGISALLQKGYLGDQSIRAGILLKDDMSLGETMAYRERHQGHELTLIHAGFTQPKALVETLCEGLAATRTKRQPPRYISSGVAPTWPFCHSSGTKRHIEPVHSRFSSVADHPFIPM